MLFPVASINQAMKLTSKHGNLDGLPAVAKQGKILNDIRETLDEEINKSLDRINNSQTGYQGQLNRLQLKWGKLSENQQYLSNLMVQLKDVQSVWKMQLNINRKINKLSQFGFGQSSNPRPHHQKVSLSIIGMCRQIIQDIHTMIHQSDRCIVQLNIFHKKSKMKKSPRNSPFRESIDSRSSMNDIVDQLQHENTLYSHLITEIFKFVFHSTVRMGNLSITIHSVGEFHGIIQCLDDVDIPPCVSYIDSTLRHSIFDPLFDTTTTTTTSSLFKVKVESDSISMNISQIPMDGKRDNLLCHNVDELMLIIQWLEKTLFASKATVCNHWKERHLFPEMDRWIIRWINAFTPILSTLLSVPNFGDSADSQIVDLQHSAIDHIHQSIRYQESIERALKTMTNMMSARYLIESLQLLAVDEEDEYGLSSRILSTVLPSKIQQFIYGSIRTKIKGHDYESFDPLHLSLFRKVLNQKQDENEEGVTTMISYKQLIDRSEAFFGAQPCKISQTMFEMVVILYNFGVYFYRLSDGVRVCISIHWLHFVV